MMHWNTSNSSYLNDTSEDGAKCVWNMWNRSWTNEYHRFHMQVDFEENVFGNLSKTGLNLHSIDKRFICFCWYLSLNDFSRCHVFPHLMSHWSLPVLLSTTHKLKKSSSKTEIFIKKPNIWFLHSSIYKKSNRLVQ